MAHSLKTRVTELLGADYPILQTGMGWVATPALVAGAVGALAAYIVVTFVMEIPFKFQMASVLQGLLVATGLVVLFGLGATWRVLGAPAVPYLKTE